MKYLSLFKKISMFSTWNYYLGLWLNKSSARPARTWDNSLCDVCSILTVTGHHHVNKTWENIWLFWKIKSYPSTQCKSPQKGSTSIHEPPLGSMWKQIYLGQIPVFFHTSILVKEIIQTKPGLQTCYEQVRKGD